MLCTVSEAPKLSCPSRQVVVAANRVFADVCAATAFAAPCLCVRVPLAPPAAYAAFLCDGLRVTVANVNEITVVVIGNASNIRVDDICVAVAAALGTQSIRATSSTRIQADLMTFCLAVTR